MTAIPSALRDYVGSNCHDIEFMTDLFVIIRDNTPINVLENVSKHFDTRINNAVSTPPSSPHAVRTGKKKPPIWFKAVTSYDPHTPNGYGIKGKFVYENKLHNEPDGAIIVAVWKDFKTKANHIYVLRRDTSATHQIQFMTPDGVTHSFPGGLIYEANPTGYPALQRVLSGLGIPELVR